MIYAEIKNKKGLKNGISLTKRKKLINFISFKDDDTRIFIFYRNSRYRSIYYSGIYHLYTSYIGNTRNLFF